jgi:hypothetical protein
MRGQWGQAARPPSTHVVKVSQVGDGKIVDQLSIDGGTPSESTHSRENYLAPQGAPVFSPYLVAFRDLPQRGSLGRVTIREPGCSGRYACDASARVLGQESVQVPAGTFTAVKVVVSHDWRASGSGSGAAAIAGLMGGRVDQLIMRATDMLGRQPGRNSGAIPRPRGSSCVRPGPDRCPRFLRGTRFSPATSRPIPMRSRT